ncbi:MAG: glycosyltransferase, partial [Pseudomonadota bacterium]
MDTTSETVPAVDAELASAEDALEASTSAPLVSAIIPCLNEERTLVICIEKAQAAFRRLGIDG